MDSETEGELHRCGTAPAQRRRRRKWVIDTDSGADDGAGLLCALSAADVDVVAVTCVWGNVGVDQAVTNALKLLEFMGRDDIPVHRGAGTPMVGTPETKGWEGHGKDGFGDADFPEPKRKAEQEHAVIALTRILGSIDRSASDDVWQLVALGPLTNIALALRLCPSLLARLGDEGVDGVSEAPGVVVMGAAQEGKGNSSLSAEFNWHCDPEAAFVVAHALGRAPRPEARMLVVSWEATLACPLTWPEYDELVGRTHNSATAAMGDEEQGMRRRAQNFLARLLGRLESFTRPQGDGSAPDTGEDEATQGATCVIPDAVAVVAALDPLGLVDEGGSRDTYVGVDLDGKASRGTSLLDWYGTEASLKKAGRWLNARILTKTRPACFMHHMLNIVHRHHIAMAGRPVP